MAFCLGASPYSDALLIAIRIPNTFRRIFAEGAFNASFLPRFSKIFYDKGKKQANDVLSDVFSGLLLILIPFSMIIMTIFPSFLRLLVSGFDLLSEKFRLTVALGRICFPYLILISLTSLFGGVLNTINKFALASAIHSLLSVFIIVGLLIGYFCDMSNSAVVHMVAWSVLLSGVAQSYLLFISIEKKEFRLNFRLHCLTDTVKDVMKNMIPGIIGAGVWQLNLLIDITISSYLPTGSITCINLADRLTQFPLGTLGIALSTALLPLLIKHITKKEYDLAMFALEKGLLFAFFLTFFATSILMALSEQAVAVAFQRGMFEVEQVRITVQAVKGFAIGLPAYVLTKVFSTIYFATGDTRSPVIFGIASIILNVLFLLLLVPIFKYFGLALCTSLSAISNAAMLMYFSRRKIPIKFTKEFWLRVTAQIVAAFVTYFSTSKLADQYWNPDWGAQGIKWFAFLAMLMLAGLLFLMITVVCLFICGHPRWQLWKKDV
jgi:putative peptidoglycan lipid II flippase